jgi:hypothetical protein
MTHTRVSTLIALAVVGGVLSWAAQALLTTAGYPSFVPPVTFGVAVGLVGVLLVVLAWPIRRYVKRHPGATPVDALYATRVVLLGKAGALAGAFFVGGALGLTVSLVVRPVVPEQAVVVTGISVVGAILLTVGGMIAERWCTVPPESDGLAIGSEEGEAA